MIKTLKHLFSRRTHASRRTRALTGGKITVQNTHKTHTLAAITHPENSKMYWQLRNWTEEELLSMPVDQLMTILTDISPEVNKAYTDFIRNCNDGWAYDVYPTHAKLIIDDFIKRIETQHHDFDALIDQIYAGIYLHGALFIELVLNETADSAINLAVIDPITARFNRKTDAVQGEFWELGQWQNGKWVSLADDPTVVYVPFNNPPNVPFGKSFMKTAPVDVVRQLTVLKEFLRVLETNGWARADFSVDSEKLKAFMPNNIRDKIEAEDEFVQDFLKGINEVFGQLKPNEGYAHLDIITVEMPKGGQMQTSFFGLVDGLMRLFDRRIGRATGSTPLKQHSNEHVTETHAREQRNDYRVNIESIQNTVAGTLSTLFAYVLQVEGVHGKVTFHFESTYDPLDVKALAEAEGIKIENLKKLKELQDIAGIDAETYQKALDHYLAGRSG